MSISSNAIRKAGPSPGNGQTTAFPFAFKVFQAAELLVVQTDNSNVETVQVITSQYTVALNTNQDSNPGGTVTMLIAPPTGFLLTIASQITNTQPVVLTNNGGFYPTVINDALDRSTIQIQQLSEQVSRAVKTSISSSTTADQILTSIITSVSTAGVSATAASGSATAAASSAVSATASATAAANSATSAASSAAAAATIVSFSPGTRLAFNQAAAPTGWTKDTSAALDDSIMRIVVGNGGGNGGATTFSTFNAQVSTAAFVLTINEMPNHTHTDSGHNHSQNAHSHSDYYQVTSVSVTRRVTTGTIGDPLTVDAITETGGSTTTGVATATNNAASANITATGGSAGHSHGITTAIKYNDFIIGVKT